MTRYKIVEFNDGEIVLYEQTKNESDPWINLGTFASFWAARRFLSPKMDTGIRKVIRSELIEVE